MSPQYMSIKCFDCIEHIKKKGVMQMNKQTDDNCKGCTYIDMYKNRQGKSKTKGVRTKGQIIIIKENEFGNRWYDVCLQWGNNHIQFIETFKRKHNAQRFIRAFLNCEWSEVSDVS